MLLWSKVATSSGDDHESCLYRSTSVLRDALKIDQHHDLELSQILVTNHALACDPQNSPHKHDVSETIRVPGRTA